MAKKDTDARSWFRFAIAVTALLQALHAQAETFTGRVIGVADGDTLTVLDERRQQHKIRLAGIDAPEKRQPFGGRSKQNLAAMAFNKNVVVEWNKRDRYGRTVGKVMVNGVDANLEQINAGMAWWYRDYAKEQSPEDRRQYEQAEAKAQMSRTGLWSDKNPVPPWDFRHGTGAAVARSLEQKTDCPCSSDDLCTGQKGGRYCITFSGTKRYR